MPLEASEKIEPFKQYYGFTHEGRLVVRGVEIRRHDTPTLIKQFQTELLSSLIAKKEIKKGYKNARLLFAKAIDRIMRSGESRVVPIKKNV